jgi:hypothetical protein
MEWIATINALNNHWCPTKTFDELKNPSDVSEFLQSLDNASLISVLSEPDVIDWLTQFYSPFVEHVIFDCFHSVFYQSNIQILLEKMKVVSPLMYTTLIRAQIPILETLQSKFNGQYIGLPFTPNNNPFLRKSEDPQAIRQLLDTNENMAKTISCKSFRTHRMPYFREVVQNFIHNSEPSEVCLLFQNCFTTKFNMHQLFVFLRDTELRQSIQTCRRDVINSFGPTIAQIYFSNPSAWCDNIETKGSQDWTIFLPQWRCVFLFLDGRQCQRFNIANESEFCVEHKNNNSTKRLKRVFTSKNDMESGPKQYNKSPGEQTQPLRYENTGRPVTSMRSIISKRSITNRPGYYIPIVRYDSLYYSSQVSQRTYCGKFFFYEPDSEHCMYIGASSAIFATKVHAYIHLARMCENQGLQVEDFERRFHALYFVREAKEHKNVLFDNMNFIRGVPSGKNLLLLLLREWKQIFQPDTDCKETIFNDANLFTEFLDTFLQYRFCQLFNSETELNNEYNNIWFPLFFPTVSLANFNSGYGVGFLDFLDQPICIMAQSLKINVVVLQHEIGSHDCVTEIMHTSHFESDISDISRIETNLQSRKYTFPKIWFPMDNGIIEINPHGTANLIPGNLSMFHTVGFQPVLSGWSQELQETKCLHMIGNMSAITQFHIPIQRQLDFDEPVSDTEEPFEYF